MKLLLRLAGRVKTHICGRLIRAHSDEKGSISIVSVFSLMLLVTLLGMVMNSGRQVDQKIKMQNAADAAGYSGGVAITRGMNALAFTNHLISDVFALTAYMREARDRSAESLTPPILYRWEQIGPIMATSEFPKFAGLGEAIIEKVPVEREMVKTAGDWAAAVSELMLPVLEQILAEEMIPNFQRSLTSATPRLAQYATDQIARRHGTGWPDSALVRGVLWRTVVDPVGGDSEGERTTLPVVDPVLGVEDNIEEYQQLAREQRAEYAATYLQAWNNEMLEFLDENAKMSQYSNLWRIFTCGHLHALLNEHPYSNLPFQIRDTYDDIEDPNTHMERDFMFVAVVYRAQIPDRIPGIFQNPVTSDTLAYSQVAVFVPRLRLRRTWTGEYYDESVAGSDTFGVPGEQIDVPRDPKIPFPIPSRVIRLRLLLATVRRTSANGGT